MQFEIVQTTEGLSELKDKWNLLINRIRDEQIFYKYEWANCFIEIFDSTLKNKLFVVVGYDKEKLILLCPFILDGGSIKFITYETTDYNMIYVDEAYNSYTLLDKTIKYILSKNQIKKICLTNFRQSPELYNLLLILRKNNYSTFLQESVVTPYLYSSENNEQKFVKKQLSDIKRRSKRLEEQYKVEYISTNIISDYDFEFIAIHREKKYGKNLFSKNNVKQFYTELGNAIPENIIVNKLFLDGNLAALHLGFQDNKKFYYYVPVYDSKYSKEGIGLCLLYHTIEENKKKKIFDFLKGDEPYKFYWCDECSMNFHLLAYKSGKSGFLATLLVKIKDLRIIRKIIGR